MNALKEAVTIPESLRERVTFQHDPTLLNDIILNDTAGLISTLDSSSADPLLAAIAKLGVYQTGASRAFISLFDKERQYIIAEATPTSSLLPEAHDDRESGEPFWLQGTGIPRCQGVCERVLNTSKTEGENSEVDLPVTIIPDIREDPIVLSATYCVLLDSSTRGYVGVPIRSRSGVDFGDYCVVMERPLEPDEWSEQKSRAIRGISELILRQLELKASKIASSRAERMTQGVGAFLEQMTAEHEKQRPLYCPESEINIAKHADEAKNRSLHKSQDHGRQSVQPRQPKPSTECFTRNNATSSEHLTQGARNCQQGVSDSGRGATVSPDGSGEAHVTPTARQFAEDSASMEQDPLAVVFSKAANIMRECIQADGVVFFDANSGFNSTNDIFEEDDMVDSASSSLSEEETIDSDASESDSTSGSHTDDCSHIIASSALDTPNLNKGSGYTTGRGISIRTLRALLKCHPKGVVFGYDESGRPQSGDMPGYISTQVASSTPYRPPRLIKRRTLSFIGNLRNDVYKAFPGARSVVFVPVKDEIKNGWVAGCFAYTRAKTRLFSKVDVNYLLSFVPLAMSECASLEARLANQAQSDVLGSLSHELRSPLHGIIAAVECLTDTNLSVFQGSLLHMLETCVRTLSDTLLHLLYYAKVNNFSPEGKNPDSGARGLRREMNFTLQERMKSITTPVRVDQLVEEVTESIFAGYNFQRMSIEEGSVRRTQEDVHPYVDPIRQRDNLEAAEDLCVGEGSFQELTSASERVVIDLAIDPNSSHHYLAISGAIRRIVMNLFGNALKYTRSGSIRVALSQEPIRGKKKKLGKTGRRWVKIVVADTGKGISEEFLANHMFQEFQQEDLIGAGLGLGLSVVHKIVSSMKGKVTIESRKGVGTTATVLLPLVPVSDSYLPLQSPEEKTDEFPKQKEKLNGLRIRFIGFGTRLGLPRLSKDARRKSRATDDEYQSIWNTCKKSLAMEVITGRQHEGLTPDVVLCEESMLKNPNINMDGLARTPLVVVCPNALSASHLSKDTDFQPPSAVTEFISQPTGPRKLAKVLVAALQRWMQWQEVQSKGKPLPLTLTPPSSSEAREQPALPLPWAPTGENQNPFGVNGGNVFTQTREPTPRANASSPPLSPRTRPLDMPKLGSRSRSNPERPQDETAPFLLVEDNPINMKMLCTYMKKLGHGYVTAEDGQFAIDRFREKPGKYRCILMDISMPRIDGLEATRQIRRLEAASKVEPVTIIALTGLASDDAQKDACQSGVNVFLTKPVTFQNISAVLREKGLV
ncbi:hypothetical protein GGS20DRAFT_588026 [Poronia punctata]|nr:hypothetical protein GGS20DRAFT_588026 [Poronia punctata]